MKHFTSEQQWVVVADDTYRSCILSCTKLNILLLYYFIINIGLYVTANNKGSIISDYCARIADGAPSLLTFPVLFATSGLHFRQAWQAGDIEWLLVWCWPSVEDGVLTLKQHWVKISCLLECHSLMPDTRDLKLCQYIIVDGGPASKQIIIHSKQYRFFKKNPSVLLPCNPWTGVVW